MSDSGTIVDGGQPKGKSQEDGLASSGAESTSTSASASPNNSSSRNNNKRPIKKRNHSSIDDHRSALSEELEAAASLVTVSTAAFVSAPAPKRPKGDNSNGTNSNPNPKNNVGVMEGDKSNDEEEDEEGGRSNDEEDEEGDSSSSEQSESAATTSSLSGSDDCVEAKGDNTNGRGNGNDSSSQKKKKKAKKPGLRKGKWTPEEEAYSTAVIRHFRAGLLRLPDGLTLRGYLAEKLNCDPMRITKKYAGAACLGKRTFTFQDRIAIGDISDAEAQLAYLEERFKLRVKTGHAAIPLPFSNMGVASLSAQAANANAAANFFLAAGRAPAPYATATTASSSSASSANSSVGNGSGPAPAPAVPMHAQQLYPQQAPSGGAAPHIHVHHGLRHPGMPQHQQQPRTAYQGPPQVQSAPQAPQMQQQQQHQAQGQPQPQQIALAALLNAGLSPAAAIAASSFSPQSLQAAVQAAIVPALAAIQQAQQPQQQPPAPSAQQENVATLLCNAIMAQQQHQQQQQQSMSWAQSQAQQVLGSLPPQALSQVLLSVLQQSQQQQQQPQPMVQGSSGPFQAHGVSPPGVAGIQQQQQAQPAGMPPQQVIGIFNNANGVPVAAAPAVAAAALAPSAAHRISPVPPEAQNPTAKPGAKLPPTVIPPAQVTAPTSEQECQSRSLSRGSDSPRSKEDEEAGTALFGFLSALRKGHEEALAKIKAEEEEEARQAKAKAKAGNGEAEAAKDSGASSSASSTANTDKDSKNAALEKATKKNVKRSTFRTVSSLTDQPSSDASSASASKESGSSDEPQQRSDHRVNIKQIGPPYSLPKQCSDISAGAGEADGQEIAVGTNPYATAPTLAPPASVTDLSSGVKTDTSSSRGSSQNDSSLGDSDESASSENKSSQDNSSNDNSSHGDGSEASSKDTTSSEDDEDEKDAKGTDKKVAVRRKSHPSSADGEPEAKKQKKVQISEFTSKNVADHNTRMNALHAAKMTTLPSAGNEAKNPPPKEQ